MTVLTGETGAGKTLVVEALQLILGGRGNPSMVRAGAAEAVVEARFVTGNGDDEVEIVIARSVPADGRSRAWVDGRHGCAVNGLAETTADLVEIHGQHEHQSLVSPAAQRIVLDSYAGTDLSEMTELHGPRLRQLADRVAELGGDAQQQSLGRPMSCATRSPRSPMPSCLIPTRTTRVTSRRNPVGMMRRPIERTAIEALEVLDPASGEDGVLGELGRAMSTLTGQRGLRRAQGAHHRRHDRPDRRHSVPCAMS